MRLAAALLLATGLGGCMSAGEPVAMPAPPAAPVAATPPSGMQFLYGSGEAAALSRQAYNALVADVRERLKAKGGASVVLQGGATLADPHFVDCGSKPPAAVFDMDETVALNFGYEYNDALINGSYDAARWKRFEQTGAQSVGAVPGAVEALAALRAMGVTVVINTNRNLDTAEGTVQALAHAGLGDFRHGETLFLKGDADGVSGKDGRRAVISQRYCVVAMGGDQLGDFSDLFKGAPVERRALTEGDAIKALWGHGWFVLPNPVYGAGLVGGMDDVFPKDKRWVDPAANGGK